MSLYDIFYYIGLVFAKFIQAILIFLIGFILGKIFGKLSYKILKEAEINRFMKKTGFDFNLDETISKLFEFLIYFITITIVLNELKILQVTFTIIAILVLLFLIGALLFGIRDFIINFFSRIYLNYKKPFKIKDKIKFERIEGTVQIIGLMRTKIKTKKGDIIVVPNSRIIKSLPTS